MKISNASKKVLASALSAAMVVAFAPTAAFAAIENGTDVTVSYDVNGGKIVDTHIDSIPSATVKVANNKLTLTDEYGTAGKDATKLTKNGAAFDGWFFDADGDGSFDTAKGDVEVTSSELNVSGDAFFGNTVKLTAKYAEPTLAPALWATSQSGSMLVSKSELAASGLTKDTQYSAKLAFPDGTTVVSATKAETADAKGEATFTFALTDAQKKAMTAGKYTFTVSDAANGVVATKAAEMVTVTLSAGATQYGTFKSDDVTSFLVHKNGQVAYSSLAKPANSTTVAGGYSFTGYTDGTNTYTSGTITIAKDTTLTALYSNPQVSTAAFVDSKNQAQNIFTGAEKGAGTLSFSVENLVAASDTAEYSATVSGPNGFSKTFKLTTDSNKSATSFTDVKLQFGQMWESDQAVTSKLEAGKYTVAVSIAAKKGQTLTEAQSAQAAVVAKSVELAAVSYDLGAGKWTTKVDSAVAQNPELPVLATVGTALSTLNGSLGTKVTGNVKADDALMGVDYYTVNGKKVSAIAATDKVEAAGVAVAVVYKSAYIAAPAVAFAPAATAGKYTMTVTPAAGTKAFYSFDGSTYKAAPDNGVVTLGASDAKVYVKVTSTDGKASSQPIEYVATKKASEDLATWATTIANTETSASDKNKPARYGDTLKTLAADAKAALAGNGYATQKDLNAAELEQYTAVLNKAAEVEKANLEAKKGLVKAADGKSYSFLSDAAYAAAEANIAKVAEAFVANNDYDETGLALNAKNNVTKVNGESVSGKTAAGYTAALKAAVTGAATTAVAVADAEAAIAVTDAFAKLPAEVTAANAKEAKAAAEAAIKAYGELSEAQKKLVPSADYDKAVQTIKAADEAVANADKAAAAKVKGKTVKAKAAKKTTAKLKVVTSESGAKSTFKKTSGNSKVTVSKTGKIVVKKGLKAGKKYTVKVKATVGASTKTVKVIVKVAK